MAVGFVGQATASDYQAITTVSYSSTQGNALILCVQHHGVSTSPTISDSAGNTWTVVDDLADATGNEGKSTMYVCFNADAITSVSVPAGSSATVAILTEWTGVAAVRASSASYAQYPASRGESVSATAGDLLISHDSVWSQNGAPPTPSAGWTATDTDNVGTNNWLAAAYQLDAAGGTESITWTMPTGVAKHGVIIASFEPASTGSPPNAGSAAGAWSVGGAATGSVIVVGSASGSWTVGGGATGVKPGAPIIPKMIPFTIGGAEGVATAAGSWEVDGSADGSRMSAGTSADGWDVAGAAAGSAPAIDGSSGTAAGSWGATGAATGSRASGGLATEGWEAAGSAAGSRMSAGSAAAAWDVGGDPTGSTQRAGGAAASWSVDGAASGTAPVVGLHDGSASGSWAATGQAAGSAALSGSAAGVVAFTGAATGSRTSSGDAAGSWEAAGSAEGGQPGVVRDIRVVALATHTGWISGSVAATWSASGTTGAPVAAGGVARGDWAAAAVAASSTSAGATTGSTGWEAAATSTSWSTAPIYFDI